MIFLDTNVIVRFVTGDDPVQARRARGLIETNEVFVTATVLLETECVLRAAYGFSAPRILGALRGLLGLPNLHADALDRLDRALKWYQDGMDFAGAMHLAFSEEAESFATFDEKLVRRARQIEAISVRVP